MTRTNTYTRQELALKRMCDEAPINMQGMRYYVTAIVRRGSSYFLHLEECEAKNIKAPNGNVIGSKAFRTVPLEAVNF